jgi:kynurenine formamidase
METTSTVILTPSTTTTVDEFLDLHTEHAHITKRLETAKKAIKNLGAGTHTGTHQDALVYTTTGAVKIDWHSVAVAFCAKHGIDFEPSHQLLTAHTTTGADSLAVKPSKKA